MRWLPILILRLPVLPKRLPLELQLVLLLLHRASVWAASEAPASWQARLLIMIIMMVAMMTRMHLPQERQAQNALALTVQVMYPALVQAVQAQVVQAQESAPASAPSPQRSRWRTFPT